MILSLAQIVDSEELLNGHGRRSRLSLLLEYSQPVLESLGLEIGEGIVPNDLVDTRFRCQDSPRDLLKVRVVHGIAEYLFIVALLPLAA